MRSRGRELAVRWWPVAAGTAIAAAAPARRVAFIRNGIDLRAIAVVAIALGACLALDAIDRRRSRPALAFATIVVASLAGAAAGGRIVGVWMVGTMVLAGWTCFGRALGGIRAYDRHSLPSVVAVSLLAARLVPAAGASPAVILTSMPAVAVAMATARWPRLQDRVIHSVARGAGVVASVVVLAPLWVVVALVPWVLHRLVGYDPLWLRHRDRAAWVPRRDGGPEPDRLWFSDPAQRGPSRARRWHARLPTVAFVAIACLVAAVALRPDPVQVPSNGVTDQLRAQAWFEDVEDVTYSLIEDVSYSQYAGYELPDVGSRHLNVVDGRRRTWRPGACPGQPVEVWMFGGSALFGVFQRDDRTLPSAVAREGASRGWNLDVENWAVPGDVAWQQNRRLERALSTGARPSVVVFYDGWNDLRTVADMDFTGRGGPTDFIGPMDRLEVRALEEMGGVDPGSWRVVRIPETSPSLSASEAVALASRSYRQAHRWGELLAADSGAEFLQVFQPSLPTRDRQPDEPEVPEGLAEQLAAMRASLPGAVLDLGDALDGAPATFLDQVHTSEAANPIVAEAIMDRLEPLLRRVEPSGGGAPCR